ncbi:Pls/PosA family non-ribosomal peptide synthetase [Enhygromyxa salina]|uniref:Pls/PosA family non-ribosomal peptide synthetase n=1 Tax=Enhygromyxa salina TaxID=215803 RepID=UPI001C626EAF|nr:Pls/PosA family non-ribosomal peptide synthetase [Enhygromyxa salina]
MPRSSPEADRRCLHELFEAQADTRPSAPAIVHAGRQLSYAQTERLANKLARYLMQHGAGPDVLVGLYMERSQRPIISILACLKTGAAYVPLDPLHPPERLRQLSIDADVGLLITESGLSDQVPSFFAGETIVWERDAPSIAEESDARIKTSASGPAPDSPCYVLFTSGTTGRPKGIVTEHRNVVHFLAAFDQVCRLSHDDRVYQGFSLGFDGSVEEIWMAFSSGAALVVGPPAIKTLGNETAEFMTRTGVTFFSTVPTFLSLITEELPTVRIIVVSGEPCTPALVDRWASPGRRLLNVYGPTETTVNATAAECVAGQPVTIGVPLPGYAVYILDPEQRPVARGQAGELFIGGPGVARGYLNQPELTAKHFVHMGELGVVYRTGDRVRANETGELEFLGRIDSQVKVRGFRVELSEIESVLREHLQVRAAVVTVQQRDGLTELAAYVVPDRAPHELDRSQLLAHLRRHLPAYMVPAYLDTIDRIPTLSSGKVDRNSLPGACSPLVATARGDRGIEAPAPGLEEKLARIWEQIFNVPAISVADDFFIDLGGYSLLATRMVSLARREHGLPVATQDVYQHPTVRGLARLLDQRNADRGGPSNTAPPPRRRTSQEVFESSSPWARRACVALQALCLLCFYGVAGAGLVVLFSIVMSVVAGALSLGAAMGILVALVVLGYPMVLGLSIALKWVIVGRYRAGAYPMWGLYYFRFWLATRVQAMSGVGLLAGTPVMNLYYRLMGAKVGRGCILDTDHCAIYDLVTIGDETSVGAQTQLPGYRIEDGLLILGRVDIGSRCFVGIHSALGLNCKMEDDSRLDNLSLLSDGETVPAGEGRRGSPAQPAEVEVPVSSTRPGKRRPVVFGLLHLLAADLVGLLLVLMAAPALVGLVLLVVYYGILVAMLATCVAIPVSVLLFCLMTAGFKALILRRLEPGVYPVQSLLFLRKWTMECMLAICSGYVRSLYTTIYLPPWLRLLGAKLGARVEVSTVSQLTPDLVTIESESFLADGATIGGRLFFRGYVKYAENRIGRRSFVGNSAILPPGEIVGDGCLIGCLSSSPAGSGRTPSGSEWLGSPPFKLPYRAKVEGFDDTVTYRPTRRLYLHRALIDALRIFLPNFIGAVTLIIFIDLAKVAYLHLSLSATFTLAGPVVLCLAVGAALSVVAIKKLVMGRFKPVIVPLWSPYVWLNEVVNGVYETIGAPILAPMLGTPFFNWYLRRMGCRIGKHSYIGTTLFSEFDLVEIGDYVALNAGVVVQNHLFEDRIMKSSYLTIGDNCSVGNMSVILYDTQMEPGSWVGPLSLLMKGETLPAHSRWHGIPTVELSTDTDTKTAMEGAHARQLP